MPPAVRVVAVQAALANLDLVAAVVWEQLSREKYEKMVSVLLSRLNPRAVRIDGAGGDEGRDVQVRVGERLELFELKSHTGRVGKSQRAQILQSLERAAALKPDIWTLMIPIDPTPGEDRWFSQLRKSNPFPLDWHGRTWLDGQMASFPDIVRYFVYSGADEAVEILKELRRDEAEFAEGVQHVVNRVEGWVRKLAELDPFWDFQIARNANGHYSITPVPKYLGAERDRPIRINMTGEFPNTAEGRKAREALAAAINYGRATTLAEEFVKEIRLVEGPQAMGGLAKGPVVISPSETPPFRADLTISVVDPDGRVLAAVPLMLTERTTGLVGSELTGADSYGVLKIRLRGNAQTRELSSDFQTSFPSNALPAQVLPVLRLLSVMRPPNEVHLLQSGKSITSATKVSLKGSPTATFITLVEALGRIQQASGVYFPIPEKFTKDDVESVDVADRLFRGEVVQSKWTQTRLTLTVTQPAPLAELIVSDNPNAFKFVTNDFAVDIGSHRVPVGQVEISLASARLANHDELEALLPLQLGLELEAVLIPGDSDTSEMRLHATSG